MQFWTVPDRAGLPTVSAEAIAQAAGITPNIFKGALVSDNGQSLSSSNQFTLLTPYAFTQYDDLSFFDGTDSFIIPDIKPAIQRVQVWFNCGWEPQTTGNRIVKIEKNGLDFDETGGEGLPASLIGNFAVGIASGDQAQNIISAPINVVPGDVFTSLAKQNSGGSLSVDDQVFGIWVVR